MLNINPEKSQSVKSYNSQTTDMRLGFAKRDRSSTEAMSIPQVIPRLGIDYQKFFSDRDVPRGSQTEQAATVKWLDSPTAFNSPRNYAVPGIMTFDYYPVFSQPTITAEGGPSDVARIFTNVWTRLRRLNNMTEKFQPSDIQWIYCAYMEILAHVANLRRILKIVQRIMKSSKSEYITAEILLRALGFSNISSIEARQNWESMWRTFNTDILGQLRNITWFTDNLVPGFRRWAGLNSEIYKDDPNRTDYTQLYLIKPAMLAHFKEGVIPETDPPRVGWSCEWENYTGSGIAALKTYLSKVAQLIEDTFYSDSASLVIATIQAIDSRNWKDDQKISFAPIDMDPIPFEGEEIAFTYDFATMLALHNATILRDAGTGVWWYPGTPFEDPEKGVIIQNFQIGTSNVEVLGRYMYNMNVVSFAKPVNLPWFEATTDDIINATQWTIATQPIKADDGTYYLPAGAVGTEILANWHMFAFRRVAPNGELQINYFNDIPVLYPDSPQSSGSFTMQDYQTSLLSLFQSFALYPMCFRVSNDYASGVTGEPSEGSVLGIINQEDVLYAASAGVLEQIHMQFARNFWGFPFILSDEGSFDESNLRKA